VSGIDRGIPHGRPIPLPHGQRNHLTAICIQSIIQNFMVVKASAWGESDIFLRFLVIYRHFVVTMFVNG
jgi:hypothetical protein